VGKKNSRSEDNQECWSHFDFQCYLFNYDVNHSVMQLFGPQRLAFYLFFMIFMSGISGLFRNPCAPARSFYTLAPQKTNLIQIMANHDPNHSSKEKTILWTIIVATLGVALLFTKINHSMQGPSEALNADAGLGQQPKKEVPAESPAAADTTHRDTTHTGAAHGADAPAH
jgi:hypothetical protein